ncbi:hypothetical protein ACM39_13455 [Chryseobacterium sp. FH2]|uniref:TonB-dependent receptor plug domain-containing protein n=1 Tax=Chryseobacterium sp. FH2 TaxID=1674291 RepID=UPI00065ABB10|nr:TonB-dependent receptor plug domain-containing protein [Chryseobacterium sp. FH2]KMQ67439.1 hypothetical protein ACM39_13455 [Chryseobacterium sp. FH2]
METNHNIDKTFNEASKALDEPATFPGFDKVWNKIEEKLDKKEEKKKTGLMWFPYGIAASLMIGVGIFYFLNKKQLVPAITSIAEGPKATTNTNIAKVDSTVKSNIEKEITTPKTSAKAEKLAYKHIGIPKKTYVFEGFYPNITEYNEKADVQSTTDTLGNKEIEQVIVMGLKREKSAMKSAMSLVSSNDISKSDSKKIVADTAEAQSFNSPFDIKNELKEPLVLGYNNSYKKNKGTAPTSVTAGKIGDKYLADKLQGSVAGLNISSFGSPGSGKVDIVVRGQSSLSTNDNPLYIVDGTMIDVEEFKKIDPEKIEALTVLKGEKALLLYGSKAANGVIVIETKDISREDKQKLKEILRKGGALNK